MDVYFPTQLLGSLKTLTIPFRYTWLEEYDGEIIPLRYSKAMSAYAWSVSTLKPIIFQLKVTCIQCHLTYHQTNHCGQFIRLISTQDLSLIVAMVHYHKFSDKPGVPPELNGCACFLRPNLSESVGGPKSVRSLDLTLGPTEMCPVFNRCLSAQDILYHTQQAH